jgi:hypothetical protein
MPLSNVPSLQNRTSKILQRGMLKVPEPPNEVDIDQVLSLPGKAGGWAKQNPAVVVGAGVGAVALLGLIPLWKYIKPKVKERKAQRSTGRRVQRSLEDEEFAGRLEGDLNDDELARLFEDPEFLEYLDELTAEGEF